MRRDVEADDVAVDRYGLIARRLVEADCMGGANGEAGAKAGGRLRVGRIHHADDDAVAVLGALRGGDEERPRLDRKERCAVGEAWLRTTEDAFEAELDVARGARVGAGQEG